MSAPENATRLPGGKLFCKLCRISILEPEWKLHESEESHIAKRGPHDPRASESHSASNSKTPRDHESSMVPQNKAQSNHSSEARNLVTGEEFLPESFFDEAPETTLEDATAAIVDDDPQKEERRNEIESCIRSALQKRSREAETSDDEDDFDWRKKKL